MEHLARILFLRLEQKSFIAVEILFYNPEPVEVAIAMLDLILKIIYEMHDSTC